MQRALRIAMVGSRGIPATFGGIEHHVEEIGARLAARGHEVTVYCRTNYAEDSSATYRGMRLRHLRTVGTKHLDAITHSMVSTLDALRSPPDIVHYHALGPGLVAPMPRYLSRAKVVLTVHGLDNQRAKWGRVARSVLSTAGWMSAHVPDTTVVVSQALAAYYASVYQRAVTVIPNGVDEPTPRPPDRIQTELGLEAGGYLLFLGRLVPEKAPDLLLRAFRSLPSGLRLVIAGGSSFTDDYVAELEARAAEDPRVLMPGYVYGDLLNELYAHAAAFVLPSALEGLPLTLLEAASYGTPVVASDILPNLEILGGEVAGRRIFLSGDEAGLRAALGRSLADPVAERQAAAAFKAEVLTRYRWEAAVDALESVYESLVAGHPPRVRD